MENGRLRMSLLPKHHDEFKTVEYWNNFFKERGQEAFEWYGSFAELQYLVNGSMGMSDSCLMIGCGNSDFSTHLYDSGRHDILNIDFSEPVINEMREKTAAGREGLRWEVMDMTDLQVADGSFDCVFDKGALDALMSNDSDESREAAERMFREIDRVLKPGGKYVCITLSETHISETFFQFFGSCSWSITVQLVESGRPSPFRPFYIVATKTSSNGLVNLQFSTLGATLAFGECRRETCAEVRKSLPDLQDFFQKQYDLGSYKPGRFEKIDLWSRTDASPASVEDSKGAVDLSAPRFTVTVVDASEEAAARAQRSFVVFMVPRGREAEFQFSSKVGMSELAEQASAKRLLAVACNRPHSFPDQNSEELRSEINPINLAFRPHSMLDSESIPIMAIDTGSPQLSTYPNPNPNPYPNPDPNRTGVDPSALGRYSNVGRLHRGRATGRQGDELGGGVPTDGVFTESELHPDRGETRACYSSLVLVVVLIWQGKEGRSKEEIWSQQGQQCQQQCQQRWQNIVDVGPGRQDPSTARCHLHGRPPLCSSCGAVSLTDYSSPLSALCQAGGLGELPKW